MRDGRNEGAARVSSGAGQGWMGLVTGGGGRAAHSAGAGGGQWRESVQPVIGAGFG